MANRRFHYDRAFEHYLRANAIPYVAVDEAKRALSGHSHGQNHGQGLERGQGQGRADATGVIPDKLKSFDFVVSSDSGPNLLVDVKGRKHTGRTGRAMQNWVTRDDVDSLGKWARLFGPGFQPAFAFLFWCEAQPPDALFHEIFAYSERWYAVLACTLEDYQAHMKQRSPRWGTVSVPAKAFHEMAQPLQRLL